MRTLMLAFGWWVVFSCAAMSASSSHILTIAHFDDLAGWQSDDHAAAFESWKLSCRRIVGHRGSFARNPQFGGRRSDWLAVCNAALKNKQLTGQQAARTFFENHFVPVSVRDSDSPKGLFTGYYEPEVLGSRSRSVEFNVPVYTKPANLIAFNAAQRKSTGLKYGRLVGSKPRAYPTREQIEKGALAGQGLEIAWLKSWADAFFMQIQGSGRVRLPGGSSMRLGYAAKSGLPYTAIGAVLIRQEHISREQISMQSIRKWMAANPGAARKLMWHNESFVFFRELKLDNPALGPLGAQQVQLTPLRSLAVDRRYWALGTPLWLQTRFSDPANDGNQQFHHLMIAQDTGSAIKGRIRGDIFFGADAAAVQLAGHLKSPGKLFALLPKPVVRRLGLTK